MYRGFTLLLNLVKIGITPWEGVVTPVAARGIDLKSSENLFWASFFCQFARLIDYEGDSLSISFLLSR
jgi:hypothetical protein